MSVLKIIPADQEYVPSPEQQANAVAVFREIMGDGEIEARVYEDLEFIDAGEYCGYVLCPSCGNRVAIHPFEGTDLAQDWYRDLDQAITARTTPIRQLQTTMPCCSASVALTSLQFDMPVGFARFALCGIDPDIESSTLSAEQLNKLEVALGCTLKQIEARY